MPEAEALAQLRAIAAQNRVLTSFIGQGYYGTHTPGVILRNILENPAWYTAYTPYQPEISQGRLEALVNFQTMVCDLTGMAIANASMLDEATAAAEAMTLALRVGRSESRRFFVADDVFPQTLDVVRTRAAPLGIDVVVGPAQDAPRAGAFAVLLQYPGGNGDVRDYRALAEALHAQGALVIVAADLLALTLLAPPGEWGADAVVGSTQRFGVPMGYGGPHAGYLATRDEFKRSLPGRLVGVTVDAHGNPAYRLALQTREQHIRREKATSNICTAQVLLAVIASMYAVYHGPDGLVADRAARAPARRDPQGRPRQAGLRRADRGVLRHDRGGHGRAHAAASWTTASRTASTSGGSTPRRSASRSTRRRRATTSSASSPCSTAATPPLTVGGARRRGGRRAAAGARAHVAVPHASGVPPPSLGDGDAALPAPARRPRPRARPRDDPARLVHDEAQRDVRDDPGHVARVRRAASVRARGRRRRATTG